MWNKIKNLSLGKKIYSVFWLLWAILLAVLIGLFTGLKGAMGEKVNPTSWTLNENKANYETLIKSSATSDLATLRTVDEDNTKYFVKDTKSTNKKANLDAMKAAIKTAIGTKWLPKYDSMSVEEIIDAIKKLTITVNNKTVLDHDTIDKMYVAVWTNTKFTTFADAIKTSDYKAIYDSSVAKTSITGSDILLTPWWNGNAYENRYVMEIGEWNTKPTAHAKTIINTTASIGLVFLVVMILAVSTTTYVSVKEKNVKKGGKK